MSTHRKRRVVWVCMECVFAYTAGEAKRAGYKCRGGHPLARIGNVIPRQPRLL